MSSLRQKIKKNASIEWVTVTFLGKRISVSLGIEAERILGTKDHELVRNGKKDIFLNGSRVDPSALIEKNCTMELRPVRLKRRKNEKRISMQGTG